MYSARVQQGHSRAVRNRQVRSDKDEARQAKESNGINLPVHKWFKTWKGEHKYLWVLEADQIKHEELKNEI